MQSHARKRRLACVSHTGPCACVVLLQFMHGFSAAVRTLVSSTLASRVSRLDALKPQRRLRRSIVVPIHHSLARFVMLKTCWSFVPMTDSNGNAAASVANRSCIPLATHGLISRRRSLQVGLAACQPCSLLGGRGVCSEPPPLQHRTASTKERRVNGLSLSSLTYYRHHHHCQAAGTLEVAGSFATICRFSYDASHRRGRQREPLTYHRDCNELAASSDDCFDYAENFDKDTAGTCLACLPIIRRGGRRPRWTCHRWQDPALETISSVLPFCQPKSSIQSKTFLSQCRQKKLHHGSRQHRLPSASIYQARHR